MTHTVFMDRHGIKWFTTEDRRAFLEHPDTPDWSQLCDDPRATLVKENAKRRVWRVVLQNIDLHVKEFLGSTKRSPWPSRSNQNAALREAGSGRFLRSQGIPSVDTVGVGLGPHSSFAATETVQDAVPFTKAWRDATQLLTPVRTHQQIAMAKTLARLAAVANRAGFLHRDHHPGNVLIRSTATMNPECLYVDFAATTMKRSPKMREIQQSLAQLSQWFRLRTTRTQRLRFLREYLHHYTSDLIATTHRHRIAKQIFTHACQNAVRLWSKRDRRIFKSNAYFAQLKLPTSDRATVTLKTRDVPNMPNASFSCITQNKWLHLLTANNQTPPPTVQHLSAEIQPAPSLRAPQNRSRVHQHFHAAHKILHRDVPTRRPIAVIESRNSDKTRTATLWLDNTPESTNLETAIEQTADTPAERSKLIHRLTRTIRRMSERGLVFKSVTHDTLSLPTSDHLPIIERPTDVEFRNTNLARDRIANARAFRRYFKNSKTPRRTDAIRFLKSLAPAHWKKIIHELRKSP